MTRAQSSAMDANVFLAGVGEMGECIAAQDWAGSPLGPMARWPQSLRTILHVICTSRHPMFLWWGPELVQFYNDGYRPSLGDRHPEALGARGREFWAEIWPIIGPQVDTIVAGGPASWHEDHLVPITRYGRVEEVYWTYSYSPVLDDGGAVAGVLVTCQETTPRVLTERRVAMLRILGERAAEARSVEDVSATAEKVLAEYDADIAFSGLYLRAEDGLRLSMTSGSFTGVALPAHVADGTPHSRSDGDGVRTSPIASAVAHTAATQEAVTLEDLRKRVGALPGGRWPDPADVAVVLPIAERAHEPPSGVIVLGVSPRLRLDDSYRTFFALVARQLATAIGNARAHEAERARVQALSELDRAKTAFFSNISHEFRTPLTLMLGPLETLLQRPEQPLPESVRAELELIRGNSLRLLRLVNTLLDFSRIEAGRMEAQYEPTDLPAYTAELASVFRSAIEKVGLKFVVDTPPLAEPVYVDREMWEKIVLNLLSNAFKFTLKGEIAVTLRQDGDAVELEVRDTGTGIPVSEQPHLFERFHRIRGASGRTHEGTGIGLALVRELVKLHGGDVSVESESGAGSTFRVRIPAGSAHLPKERVGRREEEARAAVGGAAYVEEARRWLPDDDRARERASETIDDQEPVPPLRDESLQGSRILVVDDNADMREYLARLLRQQRFQVITAGNGATAFAAAREQRPDLVLTDVMMPELDGFQLLAALRDDTATRDIPVLLLSARAGEESRIEGFQAGADDYLVKPFSGRELVARVEGHLRVARARSEVRATRRDAERKHQNLLESITDAFYALDREWRFTYINKEFERILGRTREDLLGKSIWDEYPVAVGTNLWEALHRALAEGAAQSVEYYYPPFDRWYDVRIFPSTEGLSVYFHDVTEARVAGEALERQTEELTATNTRLEAARTEAEEANRAKASFLSMMSHELRTPLNAIIGYSELLAMGLAGDLTARQQDHTARIKAASQHLLQLIDEMLTFSRIEAGHLEIHAAPTDVARLVQEASSLVAPLAEKKSLSFRSSAPDQPVTIVTDEGKARQILVNLLGNAVKFTEKGEVRLETRVAGDRVVFEIGDTGIGIPAGELETIFEPFRQASGEESRRRGGTGLGLAVSRELARLMSGDVTVESKPGHGSVFRLELPLERPGGSR